MLSLPVCEKKQSSKDSTKMIFVESKQVNLDMMDHNGAQYLKILPEKNEKFYFFSLKMK